MAPPAPVLEPGSRLGRYEIVRHVGAGAMGTVYLARDTSLRREVAIKLLLEEHARGAELRQRFLREARAVAAINHPNVVQVFDIHDHDERPFFVMEYLQGRDASQLLHRHGRLPTPVVAVIGDDAAKGLEAASEADVVHRDVKPANLVLVRKGLVKVTDFGLAKPLRSTMSAALTRTGLTLGTPDYIAPEQAMSEPVDARADIYSLGCTLFHMLSGRPPFRDPHEDVAYMEVVTRHITEPAPRLSSSDQLPLPMAELVASMMERDRERRPSYPEIRAVLRRLHPADGGALLGQFEAFERRRRTMVTQSGPVVRVLTGPALPDTSPTEGGEGGERATTAPTKVLRRRGAEQAGGDATEGGSIAAGPSTLLSLPRKHGWILVVAALLAAGAGALAYALFGGGGDPQRKAPVAPQAVISPDSAPASADLRSGPDDPLGASTCVRGASRQAPTLEVVERPISRAAAVGALPDLDSVLPRTEVARRVTHLEAEIVAHRYRYRLPSAREWQRLLRRKVIAPLPGTCEWVARANPRARLRCMTANRSFQLGERSRTRTTVVRLVRDGCRADSPAP